MAIDKYESRRIRVEIRRVLLQHWDPIGIREEPKAQDEYDGYLGGVYGLLVRGASDKEIADHLAHIVEERMGLHHAWLTPTRGASPAENSSRRPRR